MKVIVRSNLKYYYGGNGLNPYAYFKITSVAGGNQMALEGTSGGGAVRMRQTPNVVSDSMQWRIIERGSGYYRLVNKYIGDGYSFESYHLNQGASVTSGYGYSGQYWKLIPVGQGLFRMTTMYAGDENALQYADRPVIKPINNQNNQLWRLTPVFGTTVPGSSSSQWSSSCGEAAPVNFSECGAVAAGTSTCGLVASIVAACGSVAAGGSICDAVASGAGACGVDITGVGVCGAVAGVVTVCGAVASVVGTEAVGASAVETCGAVATGVGACGAVADGASACGGAFGGAGACGAEANFGAQAVGACAAVVGFCGIVACIALPIGGNW